MDSSKIRASSPQQDLHRSSSSSSLESHEGNLSIDRKKRPSSSSQEKLEENISHLKKARCSQDIHRDILNYISGRDWMTLYLDPYAFPTGGEKEFVFDLLCFLKSKDTQRKAIFSLENFLKDIAEKKINFPTTPLILKELGEGIKRDQKAEGILLEYALGTSNNKYLLGFVKEKVLPNDVVKALESFNEEYYNLQEIERVLETLKKDCSLNVEGILECLRNQYILELPDIERILADLQRASEGLEINTLDSLRIFKINIQQLKKYYTIDLTETENILRDVEEDDFTDQSNATKAIFKNLKETCFKELENFKDITKELSEDDLVSFPNAKAIIKDLRENHCIRLSNFINLSVAEGFLQKLKEAYPDSYGKIFIYSLLQNYHDRWHFTYMTIREASGLWELPRFPLILEALKAIPLDDLAEAILSILERPIRIQGDKYMTSRRFLYELSGALERKDPQDEFFSLTNLGEENYEGRWEEVVHLFQKMGLVKLTYQLNQEINSDNTETLDLEGFIATKDFAHLFAEGAAGCLGPEFKEITQAWIQNPPTQDQPWSEAQWTKLDNVFIHLFEEKPEELAIFLAWSLKSHIFLPPFSSVLEFGHSEALWEHLRSSKNKKLSEELIIKVFETEINFFPAKEKLEYDGRVIRKVIQPILSKEENIRFIRHRHLIRKEDFGIFFGKFVNEYTFGFESLLNYTLGDMFSPARDFIKKLIDDRSYILQAQTPEDKAFWINAFDGEVERELPSARQSIENQGENSEILEFVINWMKLGWH